jgi:uncharacterized membrane-anchored protein
MKSWKIVFFVATMMLLLWFPFNMISHTRRILETGAAYRFSLQPIDPYDVFRGSYVVLNYTISPIPVADSMFNYQDVYVSIGKDSAGLGYFKSAFLTPPKNADYVKTKVQYYTDGKIQIEAPENMRYYYLSEKTAPSVENALNQRLNADGGSNRAQVQVRVRRGEAAVEALYINDLPVYEFLKK